MWQSPKTRAPQVLSQRSHRVKMDVLNSFSNRDMTVHVKQHHQRLSTQGSFGGLITLAHSGHPVPKFKILSKKAGIQHKLYCLCKQCGYSEPLVSVLGTVRILPNSKFPDTSQGETLQAGSSVGKQSQACYVNSFLYNYMKSKNKPHNGKKMYFKLGEVGSSSILNQFFFICKIHSFIYWFSIY